MTVLYHFNRTKWTDMKIALSAFKSDRFARILMLPDFETLSKMQNWLDIEATGYRSQSGKILRLLDLDAKLA